MFRARAYTIDSCYVGAYLYVSSGNRIRASEEYRSY